MFQRSAFHSSILGIVSYASYHRPRHSPVITACRVKEKHSRGTLNEPSAVDVLDAPLLHRCERVGKRSGFTIHQRPHCHDDVCADSRLMRLDLHRSSFVAEGTNETVTGFVSVVLCSYFHKRTYRSPYSFTVTGTFVLMTV